MIEMILMKQLYTWLALSWKKYILCFVDADPGFFVADFFDRNFIPDNMPQDARSKWTIDLKEY